MHFLQRSIVLTVVLLHTSQGIQQQPETWQITCLIAFFPSYFVFKNENVK
jgi:flagellar biosynthesis protein FliP